MNRFWAAALALLLASAGIAHAQSLGQSGSPTISLGLHQSVNVDQIGGTTLALGQTTMSASIPVTLASNQSALAVTQSGTWNVGQTGSPWGVSISPTGATGLSNVVSTAVETGHVIKASAGNLFAFDVTSGATAGEVLIHNSATVPGAGAVTPLKCYYLPANTSIAGTWEPVPLAFSTGISISFSTATTCFTQTNSATAFISADFI